MHRVEAPLAGGRTRPKIHFAETSAAKKSMHRAGHRTPQVTARSSSRRRTLFYADRILRT